MCDISSRVDAINNNKSIQWTLSNSNYHGEFEFVWIMDSSN